jgi:soluble lytic murein transglycosylase-like protein
MSRFVLPLVVLGLMPAFSLAGPNEFLAARTKNKAVFVVEAKTLKDVQPGAFLELKGKVTGNIKGQNGAASIIFKFGEDTYIIESATTPAWLDLGVSDCRLIVQAVPNELALTPTLKLVESLPEDEAAMLDERLAIEAQKRAAQQTQQAEIDRINRELAQQSASRGATESRAHPIVGDIGARTNLSSTLAAIVPDYMGMILLQNNKISAGEAQLIAECVLAYSAHYGVDARLVMALIQHESNFNPRVTSHAGAQGLGQLMPDTSRSLGITDPFDIEQNIYGTVRTIRGHLERQSKEATDVTDLLVRALSAYNAGPGAVAKYDGMPPYAETRAYVQRVIKTYLKLTGQQ